MSLFVLDFDNGELFNMLGSIKPLRICQWHIKESVVKGNEFYGLSKFTWIKLVLTPEDTLIFDIRFPECTGHHDGYFNLENRTHYWKEVNV